MKKIITFFSSIFLSFSTLLRAGTSLPVEKPLVVILMGPPGAGKGTHAVELGKKLMIPHISTGDLFRDNLAKQTKLGKEAKGYIEKGELVPDELVVDMVFDRISNADCKKGYILDGFPRTLNQAKAFDKHLANTNTFAINLDVEDNALVERIVNRQVCKKCGTPFHKIFIKPKKEDVCDNCNGELYQRNDDKEDVVKNRLEIYHTQTQPLIDFYKDKDNLFYQVDASGKKDEIFENIIKTLSNKKA